MVAASPSSALGLSDRPRGTGASASGSRRRLVHQQAHHQSPVLNYDSLELPARRMMGRLPDGVPEVDLVGLERPDVVLDQLAGAVLLEVVR